jgi:hypothetical protein
VVGDESGILTPFPKKYGVWDEAKVTSSFRVQDKRETETPSRKEVDSETKKKD